MLVLEDARIAPVETNEAGEFTLDVLEGTYTLSISAENYYSDSVSVIAPPNGSVEADVTLKPFIGFQEASPTMTGQEKMPEPLTRQAIHGQSE